MVPSTTKKESFKRITNWYTQKNKNVQDDEFVILTIEGIQKYIQAKKKKNISKVDGESFNSKQSNMILCLSPRENININASLVYSTKDTTFLPNC